MFYSKTTNGFYDPELHGNNIPSDCVEISQKVYDDLFNGQTNGMSIVADENGYPILVERIKNDLPYGEARSFAYPSIGDQLDALFHAGVFPPEMAAKIQAVKDKYPKV